MIPTSRADEHPQLTIKIAHDLASFELSTTEGKDGKKLWKLQSSSDGIEWTDFRDILEAGALDGTLILEVEFSELPPAEEGKSLFRAAELSEREIFVRRVAEQREIWRNSGTNDYELLLRQNFGAISWRGKVQVEDNEVVSYKTINLDPPVVGDPNIPSINDLFDKIESAILQNAETINVTWDPTFGYPVTCFIDLSLELADEEKGWTVERLTVSP